LLCGFFMPKHNAKQQALKFLFLSIKIHSFG